MNGQAEHRAEFDTGCLPSHSLHVEKLPRQCAFICVLKDYRRVEDLLLAMLDHSIPGATVIDGRGMGQILGGELPIFAGVRGAFPGSAADSHIIFSVMSADQGELCMELVEHVAGPLSEPGRGVAFLMPVGLGKSQ